jgi:hypothetical protein
MTVLKRYSGKQEIASNKKSQAKAQDFQYL